METIDFKEFKQKRDSFCNKVRVGFQNAYFTVKRTVQEHPTESIVLATTVASGGYKLANSLIRAHQNNQERRYNMRHEYDNRTSEHWYAKRNLTTKQKLEIERRYNNGESKGQIMRSMGLL